MASQGPRTRLTIEKKYKIIQLLDTRTVTRKDVGIKYGIGLRTVSYIKANRKKIENFIKKHPASINSNRIVLNWPEIYEKLNTQLLLWYQECTAKGMELSWKMIQEKALELNKQLNGRSSFKASRRWVERFRNRNKLCKADLAKQLPTLIFKTDFHNLMLKEGYKLENIYNAETVGLLWKAVPETTLLYKKMKTLERREGKNLVTTFLCSNATGCHKLPVLIIGKSRDPPTIDSFFTNALSVIYRTDSKPYVDSNIFNDWFNKCFLKSVIQRQQEKGRREKTLLLLNNAGLEQENRIISTKDEFVNIMHFSCDAAPLIQPMDRGIIACFKRMYRIELLESLMPTSSNISELREEQLLHTYYNFDMNDCSWMIHNAWEDVKDPILETAWDKLLKDESEQSPEDFEIINRDINEALKKLNKMPGCGGCDSSAIMNWFEIDNKHNTDVQIDINNTLVDFINVAMDTEADIPTDVNFEYMLDDSSI